MTLSAHIIEGLVDVAAKLKSSIIAMNNRYQELPALIDLEHAMIKSGTYDRTLEEVCQKKAAIGDFLENEFELLCEQTKRLAFWWMEYCNEGKQVALGDMSQALRMLDDLLALALPHSVQSRVLYQEIEYCRDAFNQFKAASADIKPKVELNRAVVSGVMHNYQQSVAFFIDIQEAAAAPYDATGVQKASGNRSTLEIKA